MTKSQIACFDCYIGITSPSQSELLMFDTDKNKNFYKIFTDAIFQIIVKNNGLVHRRLGEGFEFYFPNTCDTNNLNAFNEALSCCFTLIEKKSIISNAMKLNDMPEISYKVAAAYEILNLTGDSATDKPTAYKIFALADISNALLIAHGLYSILVKLPEFSLYHVNNFGKFPLIGEKPNYDIYSVSKPRPADPS